MSKPIHLVADIGGTNARFALLSSTQELSQQYTLPCADYADIVSVVKAYLQRVGSPPVQAAAFAIANPVSGDRVKMTNHHWEFSIEQTRQSLGLNRLIVKNDLTALAMSIPSLADQDLIQLGGIATEQKAPLAVIAPGTGLGVSGLLPMDDQWVPLAGEGLLIGACEFEPG